MGVSRRKMMIAGCSVAAGAALPAGISALSRMGSGGLAALERAESLGVKEASYWEPLGKKRVRCTLCPRECEVADMERGYCGVRENREGKYYTLVYGRPCSVHNDPVEKKPLFHYLPGTKAFSIATAGCNMECLFCQNWNISQFRPEQVESYDFPPEKVVAFAKAAGSASVAHTYSEPVIFYEYMYDCAAIGRKEGMPNVMISNGYIKEEPMRRLAEVLGAVKVDLKAFTEKFYRESCHGRLQPVLDTLKVLKETGIWYEIVVLLVTGLNDSADEVKRLSNWVAEELSPDVPLHFSRYFPYYKLHLPRTPVATLERAHRIAKEEGCNFVYVGNVELPGKANTICPGCGETVIKRLGHLVLSSGIKDGSCSKCGRRIPGIWDGADAFKHGVIS